MQSPVLPEIPAMWKYHKDPDQVAAEHEARSLGQRNSDNRPVRRKLTLLPLVAATYLMVAGGPFNLEDVVKNAGYLGAVLALLLVPLAGKLPKDAAHLQATQAQI